MAAICRPRGQDCPRQAWNVVRTGGVLRIVNREELAKRCVLNGNPDQIHESVIHQGCLSMSEPSKESRTQKIRNGPTVRTKRPVSEARRLANQRNAQKSTGPRTPEGKARACRNN